MPSNDRERDLSRQANDVLPETKSGTTSEEDFGKTDRYANKDEGKDFNFRKIRSADAESPGVKTPE